MSSFFNGVMVYFMEQSKKQLIRELFLKKCRRWDSNPQGVNHMNLNHARLPIPPLRQEKKYLIFNVVYCLRGGSIRQSSYPLKKRYLIVFFGRVPLRQEKNI